jgi:hypothetical protein
LRLAAGIGAVVPAVRNNITLRAVRYSWRKTAEFPEPGVASGSDIMRAVPPIWTVYAGWNDSCVRDSADLTITTLSKSV